MCGGVRKTVSFAPSLYERPQRSWYGIAIGGDGDSSGGAVEVEQVVVIPGSDGDDVWLKVKRYISGATVRYIETDLFRDTMNKADGIFVDCALSYSRASTATITGLWHLRRDRRLSQQWDAGHRHGFGYWGMTVTATTDTNAIMAHLS